MFHVIRKSNLAAEAKDYVRTPAGVRRYHLPIGSLIGGPGQMVLPVHVNGPNPTLNKPQDVARARRGHRTAREAVKRAGILQNLWEETEFENDTNQPSSDAVYDALDALSELGVNDPSDSPDARSLGEAIADGEWSMFGVARQIRAAAYDLLGYNSLDNEGDSRADPHLHGGSPGWGGADTRINDPSTAAAVLLQELKHGERYQYPLYRGVTMHGTDADKFIASLREGGTFDLPLGSFTDWRPSAERFGTDVLFVLQSKARVVRGGQTVDPEFMPEEDTMSLSTADRERLSNWDPEDDGREWISGGRFVVSRVQRARNGKGYVVHIRQKGVFDLETGGTLVKQAKTAWPWAYLFDQPLTMKANPQKPDGAVKSFQVVRRAKATSPEMEFKIRRRRIQRVETQAGVDKYDQPIGTIITRDVVERAARRAGRVAARATGGPAAGSGASGRPTPSQARRKPPAKPRPTPSTAKVSHLKETASEFSNFRKFKDQNGDAYYVGSAAGYFDGHPGFVGVDAQDNVLVAADTEAQTVKNLDTWIADNIKPVTKPKGPRKKPGPKKGSTHPRQNKGPSVASILKKSGGDLTLADKDGKEHTGELNPTAPAVSGASHGKPLVKSRPSNTSRQDPRDYLMRGGKPVQSEELRIKAHLKLGGSQDAVDKAKREGRPFKLAPARDNEHLWFPKDDSSPVAYSFRQAKPLLDKDGNQVRKVVDGVSVPQFVPGEFGPRSTIYAKTYMDANVQNNHARAIELATKMHALDAALLKEAKKDPRAASVVLMRLLGIRPNTKNEEAQARDLAKKSPLKARGLRARGIDPTEPIFGATSLRKKHVRIENGKAYIEFRGKEHVWNTHVTDDPFVVDVLDAWLKKTKKPEDPLFPGVDANDTKAYIRKHIPGTNNKDLRTYLATEIAVRLMRQHPEPKTQDELDRYKAEIAAQVALTLNNVAKQALGSYIAGPIWRKWEKGVAPEQKALSLTEWEEKRLLHVRTAEGARRYGQPIGSVIETDKVPFNVRRRSSGSSSPSFGSSRKPSGSSGRSALTTPSTTPAVSSSSRTARFAPGEFSEADVQAFVNGSAADHIVLGSDGVWRFTSERQALHRRIIDSFFDGVPTGQAHPVYNIMGGGPAAGKSSMEKKTPELSKDTAVVNADDIKLMLPEYQTAGAKAAAFTHEESSYLAKMALQEGFRRRAHMTLDGTGDSSAEGLAKKIKAARDAGYEVHGYYVTVATDEAVKRAEARGRKTGRYVPESVIRRTHASVSSVVPEMVDQFDSFVLYDTTNGLDLVGKKERGKKFKVENEDLYKAFLAKGSE